MANIRSIFIVTLIITLFIQLSLALYEDQVGKFDWKRSFIGKVNRAKLDLKRLIVTTEENVLASLNLKNGNILWRQVLEQPRMNEVRLLHVDRSVITVSGSLGNWFVRSWDIVTGTLLSDWNSIAENAQFTVSKDTLLQVVPVLGSHIEVSSYSLHSGELREKITKISAPWVTDVTNCITTNGYYVCLSSNDQHGQLYYVNLIQPDHTVHTRQIGSLIDHGTDGVQIREFEDDVPSFLLITNVQAKLILIENNGLQAVPHQFMPNVITTEFNSKMLYHQLEASRNPNKLIQVKSIGSENEEYIQELDYPVGLGVPTILAGYTRGPTTDLLLTTSDDAVLLVRLPEGKVVWTREEALSNIIAAEFVELPVSELDASIENEFKTSSTNVLNMLLHRLTTQAKQLSNLLFGSQLLANNGLVRDDFGLHKLIVVVTRVGKLFAIDTLTGSIAWSYRLPNIRPFDVLSENQVLLFVQRTARYAPLPAQCILVAEDSVTGRGVIFQFDPITGYSEQGIEKLDYKVAQGLLLPYEDENYLKPVLIITSSNMVYIYPKTAVGLVYPHRSKTYIYLVDVESSVLKGYNFVHSTSDSLKLTPMWNMNFFPSKLVDVSTKPPNERAHSQGRVLPDRSVYYKYLNPNLVAVATLNEDPVHKHVLSIYLVDGVSGLVLYSTSHKRAKGPVHMVHSENWLVYSYFNERFRRTEIAAAEFYEGHIQSNSTVFSSYAVSLLPDVQTQCYILPAHLQELAVTITERGITNKFLLLALSNGAVVEIPWLLLQPRFDNIPCGPEESCIPYMPEIPLPPEAFINYNLTLDGIRGISVAPAKLESTIHVLVYGLDLFYTRVAPSKTFDLLKEDFDHGMIVLVLSGLIVASYVTKYLASKKALKQLWK